jgi:mannose-6-phosphate isomerase-like protein (cupin superfamily)
MVRGRATFVIDEETLLTSGELLLVPPDVRHSFRWDQSSKPAWLCPFWIRRWGRAIAPDVG